MSLNKNSNIEQNSDSNIELKVIKNKENMNNTKFFDSLNKAHNNEYKDANIGLELLVNQNKNRNKNSEDINIVRSVSKEEYIMDALEEQQIDINDRDSSREKDNDQLSFHSYSSNKKEKKIHTFDISNSNPNPQFFSHEDLDKISEDIMPEINNQQNLYNSEYEKPHYNDRKTETINFKDIRREKEELLFKFEKLRRLGTNLPKTFNMTSDLNEMKNVYERIRKSREQESGVKFSRKMLVACTTAIEFLNNKFDPLDIKLEGWSESIHENINDYDEVFEELYEKYQTDTKIAPELKLIFMVAGSGFMFHLTNTMFKSSMPGMGDILKQNPNLMKQFASAAMNTMGNNMAKESSDDLDNIPMPTSEQKNMKGPSGIEDILNELASDNLSSQLSNDKKHFNFT